MKPGRRIIGLTASRSRVLEAILAHVAAEQWPPTLRELCDRLGVSSTNGVTQVLDVLEREGIIERERGKPRAMRITSKGRDQLESWRRARADGSAREEGV